jgi:hypothetical protein
MKAVMAWSALMLSYPVFSFSVYLASLLHLRIFSVYVHFQFLILKLQAFHLDCMCILVSFNTISSESFI